MMATMAELTRRAVLRLGAGAAAGAAGAFALGSTFNRPTVTATPVTMTGVGVPLAPPPAVAEPAPTYVTGSFVSQARGGVSTNWAIARPPGQTAPLRPVIALHGKGSDAATVMAGGVEQGLAQAVAAGLPPFAVVAVDGATTTSGPATPPTVRYSASTARMHTSAMQAPRCARSRRAPGSADLGLPAVAGPVTQPWLQPRFWLWIS